MEIEIPKNCPQILVTGGTDSDIEKITAKIISSIETSLGSKSKAIAGTKSKGDISRVKGLDMYLSLRDAMDVAIETSYGLKSVYKDRSVLLLLDFDSCEITNVVTKKLANAISTFRARNIYTIIKCKDIELVSHVLGLVGAHVVLKTDSETSLRILGNEDAVDLKDGEFIMNSLCSLNYTKSSVDKIGV